MQSQHAWSHSGMQSQQVSQEQLMALILSGGLADDVVYEVNGVVSIFGCADLHTLSGNISVASDVYINSCPNLKELSANLLVKGVLSIDHCPKLEKVSGSICVNGSLLCNGANSLTEVSGSLCVDGGVHMAHCNKLKDIIGKLYIKDELDLERCKTLEDLSGNITVYGPLILTSCYSLRNLSGTFVVGGNINLDDCPRLNCLPDWITSLGCKATGEKRIIELEDSGLSKASVDQAQSVAAPGMQFCFSEELEAVDHFEEIGLALAFWGEMASCDTEIPDLNLIGYEQECDLLKFLRLLTCSADYRDESSRPALARQVMEVMTVLAADSQLREKALEWVSDLESESESEDADHERAIQILKNLEALQCPGQPLTVGRQLKK